MAMQKLILAYHGVGEFGAGECQWIQCGNRCYDIGDLSVRVDLFEKQLAYLRGKGYKDISLRDFLAYETKDKEPAPKRVAITFDDGFKNFFTLAQPLLKKYGYRATIFLITDKIGQSSFLSWQEIRQLQKQGFSFGAHTCSHPALTELPLDAAEQEIEESKKIIEQNLVKQVDLVRGSKVKKENQSRQTSNGVEFFCYPYGRFNSEIQRLVKQAGF